MTHRGLAIELALVKSLTTDMDDMNVFTAALQCASVRDLDFPVEIQLMRVNQHDMIRTSPHTLIFDYRRPRKDGDAHQNELVYIRPTDKYNFTVGTNQAPTFYIRISSQPAPGFSISETYQCQPQLSFWDKAQREECMKVEIDLQDNLAAILLKNDESEHQEAFAILLIASESTPQMDVVVPTGSETLAEIVENKSSQLDQHTDRFERFLSYDLTMSAALRRRDTGCFIDIHIFQTDFESDS